MNDMDAKRLKAKVLEEVQQVPEHRLADLYELIRHFRLDLEATERSTNSSMAYAGCWQDWPEVTFDHFVADISNRRHQAFLRRRTDETCDG